MINIIHLLLSIVAFFLGWICLISGLKKKKESFFWLFGLGHLIKSPALNIIYGIILILVSGFAIIWYTSKLM